MNIDLDKEMKTLRVSEETHSELVKLGGYNDTMEDIIKRLLEHYQKSKK